MSNTVWDEVIEEMLRFRNAWQLQVENYDYKSFTKSLHGVREIMLGLRKAPDLVQHVAGVYFETTLQMQCGKLLEKIAPIVARHRGWEPLDLPGAQPSNPDLVLRGRPQGRVIIHCIEIKSSPDSSCGTAVSQNANNLDGWRLVAQQYDPSAYVTTIRMSLSGRNFQPKGSAPRLASGVAPPGKFQHNYPSAKSWYLLSGDSHFHCTLHHLLQKRMGKQVGLFDTLLRAKVPELVDELKNRGLLLKGGVVDYGKLIEEIQGITSWTTDMIQMGFDGDLGTPSTIPLSSTPIPTPVAAIPGLELFAP